MAPGLDLRRVFDQPDHSDITIKAGILEYKCHKVILADVSEYFKKALAPGFWAEGSQAVIESKEDDPDAVAIMLRHVYDHSYEIIMLDHRDADVEFHLQVYAVADKYLLHTLKTQAAAAFDREGSAIDEDCVMTKDAEFVFNLVKVLHQHKDTIKIAKTKYDQLVLKHFAALFALKDFRKWTEKRSDELMEAAVSAVERGHNVEKHWLAACAKCGHKWVERKNKDRNCPYHPNSSTIPNKTYSFCYEKIV